MAGNDKESDATLRTILLAALLAALSPPLSASARPIGDVDWPMLPAAQKPIHRHLVVPQAVRPAPAPASSMAEVASVRAVLLCIHPYEEPSWSTTAGGLGFVYPPSSYPVDKLDHQLVDPLIRLYGDAWPAWPMEAQLVVGAMLVRHYGYQPWTTAYHCT